MLSLTFFTAHTSLGCRKCLIGMLFDHKPDTLLPRTLYRTRVAAHDILKVQEEDAMNDELFATLSNYRERTSKLTGISNKTLDQSGRVVKAYEYYQTCIATKTFEFFGFLSEARNDTLNLTACCTNVPYLILLKIGHLCSSFVQVFP